MSHGVRVAQKGPPQRDGRLRSSPHFPRAGGSSSQSQSTVPALAFVEPPPAGTKRIVKPSRITIWLLTKRLPSST